MPSELVHCDSGLSRKQREVPVVGGDDARAMATRGEGDEGVVLKFPALDDVPALRVADLADDAACLPPVIGGRLPLHDGEPMERLDEPLRDLGAGARRSSDSTTEEWRMMLPCRTTASSPL